MARRGGGAALRPRPPQRRCRPMRLLLLGGLLTFAVVLAMARWQQTLLHADDPVHRNAAGGGGAANTRGPPPPPRALRFVPADLVRRLGERGGVAGVRSGVRPPRIALVAGLNKDSQSLMLLTLVKGLKELGYIFTVFALENGEDHSLWEHVGCQVSVLSTDGSDSIDWSNYEGVILNSLEAQRAMSSFMHEPFDSIPVIWIVQEDTLGTHLSSYKDMGWQHLIAVWRSAFSRADVVVFPDFSLPMLYTTLDTGNFYVIPQSPVDIWAAKSYNRSHSRDQLRKESGFNEDDLIVLVIGSYFFYDDLPQDYAKAINALGGKFATSTNGGRIRCVILSGNSTEAQDSDFQRCYVITNSTQ